MKPIEFKECNIVLGEDQPEYLPLPAHRWLGGDPGGTITSCWSLSIRERIRVLFTGRIYLQLLTFKKPIQPQLMSVENPINDKK